jgi:hypothetical protein
MLRSPVMLALVTSCSWGGYSGAVTADGGIGVPCDGVTTLCATSLLCVSLGCRSLCSADSDCPSDSRCLLVSVGSDGGGPTQGVCMDSASTACASSCGGQCECPGPTCGFCPANTECASDGHCRNESACAGGETGGSGMSCFGSPPHDTPPMSGTESGSGPGGSSGDAASGCPTITIAGQCP